MLDSVPENFPVNRIPISYQVFGCGIPRAGFHNLLSSPFGSGMPGHVEMQDLSSVMPENDAYEQNPEFHGGYCEKIHGKGVVHVILYEGSPRLRWRFCWPASLDDIEDCSFRNVKAEF